MLIIKIKTNESNSYTDTIVHKLFNDLKLDWQYEDQTPKPPPPLPAAGGLFGGNAGFGGNLGGFGPNPAGSAFNFGQDQDKEE